MDNKDTGLLLNGNNIKLHRQYFNEMVKLLGIQCIYRAPRENKHYNGYGELDSFYYEPMVVGCIFEEHPKQWTMKKLGWNSELNEDVSLISVPYDTPKLQNGSLFIIPSGIDGAEGRVFRVLRMNTIGVYPASVTCVIGPMWTSVSEPSEVVDHKNNDFSLLNEEED